tara:strand:- start:40 stop:216 length:177 start_codon:yes stop_codon:yes gene_type:complete
MSNTDQSLKVILEFTGLPLTDEKEEINRQYLEDELSSFDFYIKAEEYLNRVKDLTLGD